MNGLVILSDSHLEGERELELKPKQVDSLDNRGCPGSGVLGFGRKYPYTGCTSIHADVLVTKRSRTKNTSTPTAAASVARREQNEGKGCTKGMTPRVYVPSMGHGRHTNGVLPLVTASKSTSTMNDVRRDRLKRAHLVSRSRTGCAQLSKADTRTQLLST